MAKNVLYWFSGTGNSLVVAKELAKLMGDTDLVKITNADPLQVKKYERVGFVFPVYMWGPPLFVMDFIKKADFSDDSYIFSLITCGGIPGATLYILDEALKKKNTWLSSGFWVRLPGNYTPLYGARPGQAQNNLFKKMPDKIKNVVDRIKNKQKIKLEKSFFLFNFISATFYKLCAHTMPKAAKGFFVTDKCTKCGVCAKVCPVKNITLVDGRPTWGDKCEQCLACLQWCPTEAIQLGKITINRKRYRHPDVRVDEFFS